MNLIPQSAQIVMFWALPILIVLSEILGEVWRIKDAWSVNGYDGKYTKQWHFYKGIQNGLFFSLVAIVGIKYAVSPIALFIGLRNGLINTMCFNRSFWYIGTTSASDKLIRKIFSNPSFIMMILRVVICVMLISSLFFL